MSESPHAGNHGHTKNVFPTARVIIFLVFCFSIPGITSGDNVVLAADTQALEQQIKRMQQDLNRPMNELKVVREKQALSAVADAEDKAKEGFRFSTKGGIKVESGNGNFKAQIGGRLMADAAWFNEDKTNMDDDTEIRRVRLHLAGTIFKDWHFKTEWDFAGNAVSAKDVWIKYTGWKSFHNLDITVGHHKIPMMVENVTSSRFITFMERSTAHGAFVGGVGDRQIGISGNIHGDNWSFTGGIWGADVDDDALGEGDDDWQTGVRLTHAHYHDKGRVLHFGLWGNYFENQDSSSITFEPRPESHIMSGMVSTGAITTTDDLVRWGGEVAGVYGPVSLQGEYVRVDIDRTSSSDVTTDFDFYGWYLEGSYFLTGETRPYSVKKGGFGRVKPLKSLHRGGLGAWQVAARYSGIDLDDGTITGGVEHNMTLGLNWYVNPYVRFMANYILVDNNDNATNNSGNLHADESSAANDDPQIFMLRAQVDF